MTYCVFKVLEIHGDKFKTLKLLVPYFTARGEYIPFEGGLYAGLWFVTIPVTLFHHYVLKGLAAWINKVLEDLWD